LSVCIAFPQATDRQITAKMFLVAPGYLRNECQENGIGVDFCNDLFIDDTYINPEKALILKLDSFYHTQRMAKPPKSPDYLVILKCPDGSYNLYIIELRNVSGTAGIPRKTIIDKFSTIIEDFFPKQFPKYFNTETNKINNISLYLVTDPFKIASKGLTDDEIRQYISGSNLDAYSSMDPLIYNGKPLIIEPKLPNPKICKCEDTACK
jgi:hypothetical protein